MISIHTRAASKQRALVAASVVLLVGLGAGCGDDTYAEDDAKGRSANAATSGDAANAATPTTSTTNNTPEPPETTPTTDVGDEVARCEAIQDPSRCSEVTHCIASGGRFGYATYTPEEGCAYPDHNFCVYIPNAGLNNGTWVWAYRDADGFQEALVMGGMWLPYNWIGCGSINVFEDAPEVCQCLSDPSAPRE